MKVLKIGASWCPECIIMKPRWAEIESELSWLKTEFIDIDEKPETKQEYHIDHVPTFIFFDESGQEIDRLKGLVEKDDLIEKINEYKDQ